MNVQNKRKFNIRNRSVREEFPYNNIMYTRKVSKTLKGGKNMSFYVIAVVGDYNGSIGIASGKSRTIASAIDKAFINAKASVINPGKPRHINFEHCATKLIISPRKDEVIHAAKYLSEILEAGGYKNVNCKIIGSRTMVNVIFCLKNALKHIRKLNLIEGAEKGIDTSDLNKGPKLVKLNFKKKWNNKDNKKRRVK